jgi:hypothetical protein
VGNWALSIVLVGSIYFRHSIKGAPAFISVVFSSPIERLCIGRSTIGAKVSLSIVGSQFLHSLSSIGLLV